MTSQERAFREFSDFAAKLKGDEKSEAQTFLFRLLAAFGHDPDSLPENSAFEYRVRFPQESGLQTTPGGGGISVVNRRTRLSLRAFATGIHCIGSWPLFFPDLSWRSNVGWS